MFERVSRSGNLQLKTTPFGSLDALGELSALLARALKTSTASSNAPLSSASRSSHDQIQGEAYASDYGESGEPRQHKLPRGRQQVDLFDSPRPESGGAPLWPELPERARPALMELMARLILAHAATAAPLSAKEAGDDL